MVILTGAERFALSHGAAWELSNPTQKATFDKWLAQSKLPKDLGQLVAGAPTDHEVAFAGEFDASINTSGEVTLTYKRDSLLPKTMKLSVTPEGAKLDPEGTQEFADISKDLGKSPSTLLVSMSSSSGSVSESKAWLAVLSRLQSKSEFFITLEGKHGLLWVRQVSPTITTPAADPKLTGPAVSDSATHPTDEKPADSDKGKTDTFGLILLILKGLFFILIGGVGGYFYGMRSRQVKLERNAPEGAATVPVKFIVNANERELVEKVRDEIRKLGWEPNHIPSAEDYVVGEMIDRYNLAGSLNQELGRLQAYKKFKEDHDAFQKRIDVAVAEAKANSDKASDFAKQLEIERSKVQTATAELQQSRTANSEGTVALTAAQNRIKELERKDSAFQSMYVELVSRTSAVCHDIVITRPRGDAWALAFAYLVDYTLAYLGLARQCNDSRAFDAMLVNLSRLADAMAKSFPDRKLVIDPWKRAVMAFGDVKAPTYDQKPHPQVDSLSQILLTLRDTGPSLTEFREFFAASDAGLHIIRPA